MVASACGDGGGGKGLNEGAYDVSDFGYTDPRPSSFHPLGDDSHFAAVRRDEVACLLALGDAFEIEDDQPWGGKAPEPMSPGLTQDMVPIDASTGDLDGDGRPELVVIGVFSANGEAHLTVRVGRRDESGWSVAGSFDLGVAGEDYDHGRIDLGDVDGDGRAEIVVAANFGVHRGWVRVFEDPVQAGEHGQELFGLSFFDSVEAGAITAQLDDDPARELVVHEQSHALDAGIAHVFDDALRGFARLTTNAAPLYADDAPISELVAVNRDEDGRQEIGVVRSAKMSLEVFDDALGGFEELSSEEFPGAGNFWQHDDLMQHRHVKAGDLDGDGKSEVVSIASVGGGPPFHDQVPHVMTHWGTGGLTRIPPPSDFDPGEPYVGWDLAVVDNDADGRSEILWAPLALGRPGHVFGLTFDPDAPGRLAYHGYSDLAAQAPFVVLAGADFDQDGVVLSWTGEKHLHLPNPFLMAVLAAPPTQRGISQNYEASDVSYSVSQGWQHSYETSTTHSASLSVGYKWKDVFGVSELSVKGTLTGALASSSGEASSVETSTSFTGSHDHDVVIFQGTLNMVYVYEIQSAADPAVVGTEMTINVPVGTRIYKWTREFFEQQFGEDTALPSSVLPHSIGHPESYASEAAAQALLATHEGFEGDAITVGQGNGSNGVGLALSDEITNGDSWSWGIGIDIEGEIGGLQGGISYSFDREHITEVTVTRGTSYDATIGDIADHGEYTDWGYDVGIFTYRHEEAERAPFQVVTFWTEPWGGAY